METTKRLQILNMDWPYFILAFVILNLALFFKFLPGSLAGVLPLLIVYGEAFRFIGDRIPIVKDYLGGGSIVVLFGTSAMVMYGLVPDDFAKTCKTFMTGTFINFALAALCCGSIFGMDRKLLIRAACRIIVAQRDPSVFYCADLSCQRFQQVIFIFHLQGRILQNLS